MSGHERAQTWHSGGSVVGVLCECGLEFEIKEHARHQEAWAIVTLPDAEREKAVSAAEGSEVLWDALEIAKRHGMAYAAADIAYELGRRVYEGDKWDE